jgi:hypothetical protein
VNINFHSPKAPSIVQVATHGETADYLDEAQKLISRLDHQIGHDNRSLQTPAGADASDIMLGNLEKRAAGLLEISPPEETVKIPYAQMDDEERRDALGDIGLSLTRAFLAAAFVNPEMCIDDVEIHVEPAARDNIKKALLNGSLSPVTQKKGLILDGSSLFGLDLRHA